MVDVNEQETNNFNRIIVSMLEEMIRRNDYETEIELVDDSQGEVVMSSFFNFDFDNLVETFTIQNIMSASMDEDMDKMLLKNDTIELKFDNNVYNKDNYTESHTCCVCLDDIENNDFVYVCDNCNTIHHHDCMNEWVKRKVECPACRHNIKHKIYIKDEFVKFIEKELDI